MTNQEKLQTVCAFLDNDDNYHTDDGNKQDLYNLVYTLRQVIENQLAVERGEEEPHAFPEEERLACFNWAVYYLGLDGNNEGNEESLMVRYFRDYFEPVNELVSELGFPPPRLERGMNITSPFQ